MNLYELAHHPDAWKKGERSQLSWVDYFSYFEDENIFRFLNETDKWEGDTWSTNNPVSMHTDENEYRMHLLFAYWATQYSWPEKESQ